VPTNICESLYIAGRGDNVYARLIADEIFASSIVEREKNWLKLNVYFI
jgi:hypothetical protein